MTEESVSPDTRHLEIDRSMVDRALKAIIITLRQETGLIQGYTSPS